MRRLPARWTLVLAGILLLAAGCGDRRPFREVDQIEEQLRLLIEASTRGLEGSDLTGLRTHKEELTRLRLRAQSLQVKPKARAARDSLLVALDAVIDGVGAAILGIEGIGDASGPPEAGTHAVSPNVAGSGGTGGDLTGRTERLRASAAHLRQCEGYLDRAATALHHYHEERARLEAGHR